MPPDIESVRKRAEAAIGSSPDKNRKDLLAAYKQFIKTERERIKAAYDGGASGVAVAQQRSDLMDVVLQNLLATALGHSGATGTPVTLVAQGGYGRGVLNPGSDLDLLFLTPKSASKISQTTKDVIEEILYMLWDTGLKVGHAVRSVVEATKFANQDPQARTAMIEMRLVSGDSALLDDLRERFYKSCVAGKEKEFLIERLHDRRASLKEYGNTVYLQEPNVKRGPGGLRDYHNLRWVSFVYFRDPNISRLVKEGLLTEGAYRELEEAHDFLLRVRSGLHFAEKSSSDILTLRLQGIIATEFEYPERTILRRCESFMKDYYQHTHNMLMRNAEVFDRLEIAQVEAAPLRKVTGLILKKRRRESFDGFYVENDRLYPENLSIFEDDSIRMMRAFQHSQMRGLRFSAELCNLIQANFFRIDKGFRCNPDAWVVFESILFRKGMVSLSLRQMHRLGFLGEYMPEFGALTCLVQHEFFHRYTADEHTLRCIDLLDDLVDSEKSSERLMRDFFLRMPDAPILYLALILHDSGRAANLRTHADASAVLASRVATRMNLSRERRQLLLFLVDHHLTLWQTATTRNCSDPEVVEEFAKIVGDQSRLSTLLVMTYVDANGTSNQSWTSWKEALITQLYYATSAFFVDSAAFRERAERKPAELLAQVRKLLPETYATDVDAHFENMPPHYFHFRGTGSIVRHVKQFRELKRLEEEGAAEGEPEAVYRWTPAIQAGHTKLVVTSRDRHALVARIAGSLAAARLNILGADIYRREDGLVLDVFRVCTASLGPAPSDSSKKTFERVFRDSWNDPDFDFGPLIEAASPKGSHQETTGIDVPRRVLINNHERPDQTVVHIQTQDRLGLLYNLLHALSQFAVEITNARIGTEKGAAVDVLYLKHQKGEKIRDKALLDRIREALEKVAL